jgi:hypothetical protein
MCVSKQRIIKYKPTNAFLKLTKAYVSNPTQIVGMHLVMSP